MKILITGGNGFLCKGMIEPLAKAGHELRLLDVKPFESDHEVFVGDVSNFDNVLEACKDMDGIIIAHMLSRSSDAYQSPGPVFDVNVKGTANVFQAAVALGISKIVLISSEAVISRHADLPDANKRHLPMRSKNGLYGLGKILQEVIAEQYAFEHHLQVDALRVGYIVDGEKGQDKYGRQVKERAAPDVDRRDIGEVARLCLERENPGYEFFHVMSTPESMVEHDVQYTCDQLNWKPKYDFTWLPWHGDPKEAKA
ncbi:NAD(P)-dependent oxidoreductase [Kiritimatiellaeota bacterium B1221]|nr:NAD(P)-dependent oxidoreductase [Kiritimatiellaeota bacterium B1221]